MAVARLLAYPKFDAGVDLAGGKVYTYLAGTTTNKATYADQGQAATNTNPVILDANGQADIWLDTDEAYKIVLKTSADVTQWTVDELDGVSRALNSGTTVLAESLDVNSFSIVSSSNGNIPITPNGTGDVVLDGMNWPQADGTAGQLLKTDGAAQLSWVSAASGSMNDLADDTSPQLGGTLDTNAFNIEFDTTKGIFDDSANEQLTFTKTASAVNYLTVTNAAGGGSPKIAASGSDTNVSLSLQPQAGGNLILDTHTWPNSDGTNGQTLVTDGSGGLTFGAASSSGKLLQIQTATDTAADSTTTAIPLDNSIPQNTEGEEAGTVTITPANASNTLIIEVSVGLTDVSGSTSWIGAIFQDTTADALAAAVHETDQGLANNLTLRHVMAAGTTSPTTFKFRYGSPSGTAYINQSSAATLGGVAYTNITVTEVSA